MHSEFFAEGVLAPTFFCHSKFGVKNFLEFFHLKVTVDPEFYRGGSGPTYFDNAKFETKKILWNVFVCRALWTEFFRVGYGPTFIGEIKFETKKFFGIFSFTEHSGLRIFKRMCPGTNFFMVTLNLKLKIFWNFLFTVHSGL